MKSDGCSGGLMCALRLFWRTRHALGMSEQRIPPWEPDCERHDEVYAPGGSVTERLNADIELMQAVKRHGYPRLARLMFVGVSVGGVWWLPLPWRWGFGAKYPKRYTKGQP